MDDAAPIRTRATLGIALAVAVTAAAALLLAPKVREAFQEDIFSGPATPMAALLPAPATPVPNGSLAANETVVDDAPRPVLRKATRLSHPVKTARRDKAGTRHLARVREHAHRAFAEARSWRSGVNRDAPSSSPTDPQPGA